MEDIKDINDNNKLHVYFGENTVNIYEDDKNNNFNDEYRKNRDNNVRLARMERYFRKMHLLEKYEMLSIENYPQHHLRINFLICIADDRKWIDSDEYLHIHVK
jgi:hypothetical protein